MTDKPDITPERVAELAVMFSGWKIHGEDCDAYGDPEHENDSWWQPEPQHADCTCGLSQIIEAATALHQLQARIAEAELKTKLYLNMLTGSKESLEGLSDGDKLPPYFGLFCTVMIEAFKNEPRAENYLDMSVTDKDGDAWVFRVSPADRDASWKQRAESAEARLSGLADKYDTLERVSKDTISALQARLDASPHAEGCGVWRCNEHDDGEECGEREHWHSDGRLDLCGHDFQPGPCNCHKSDDWQPDAAGGGA